MLEKARRLRNLEGSTRVEVAGPADFFAAARAEYDHLPVWRGELYLENHRGTYTSQARTKRGNRRAEALLREAELWSVAAAVRCGAPYPYEHLESIWQRVLLHQFHDILPGSSIAWVHQEAEAVHASLQAELADVIGTALAGGQGLSFFNAGPYPRREVARVPGALIVPDAATVDVQTLSDGGHAVLVEAPALGSGAAVPSTLPPVRVVEDGSGTVLDNGVLRVVVDARGLVRSVYDHRARREAIDPERPGNLLQLHPDDPNLWSAWNIDGYYRDTVTDLVEADSVAVVDAGPLLASVRVERSFGASHLVQHLELAAGSHVVTVRTDIDWQERDTLLKAAWPLRVHAEQESAEIQFGHVQRPTHENTSWDAARFELWAHRWVHVGEHGWGAALVNDSTYGHDVSRQVRADGGTTTTVRLSLLRSPHSPDPQADRGRHGFSYGLAVGVDVGGAVAAGYAFNLPLRPGGSAPAGGPALVDTGNPDLVVEAVKLADDRSGDVVVRLYESRGGTARGLLRTGFPVASVQEVDLLENPYEPARPLAADPDGGLPLELRPFQILTLRLRRA
jgi:alpha-mannosidase